MKPLDSDDLERVARILERHISPIHARSMLRHVLSGHKIQPLQFRLADLATIRASLHRGFLLFTSEAVAARALHEISQLGNVSADPIEPCMIEIKTEGDISVARGVVRKMCEHAGAKPFTLQKVTTIVSELARNIVSYSVGGKVELHGKPSGSGRPIMVIRASDNGPGILNLSHILSGDYKSKTGLGRGLLGCKRLANHFDITTGPRGTTILVEIEL